MADIELIIKIDEDVFTRLFDNGTENYGIANDDIFDMARAIRKGTPLPKGHGRLIDADDLANLYNENDRLWWSNAMDEINEGVVPTIIDADKEEK